MRIYRMTATFGKLEHETLTLEPGLNIITAPNEWGKSTWCAFLLAMLYGLDTRAKSTKGSLADKERYAPWSGSPMAGRIDLNWNGRDITIERSTKRRMPLGEFRAYETNSGLDVPELTASNCGQMLLGVEQSVFRRAGFLKQADLPVTQDEALRRRLNALVTTGDESGAADKLAQDLKDLKNKCRYNRTGLLPQAEARQRELEGKLEEYAALQEQTGKLQSRLGELVAWQDALTNHQAALDCAAASADAARVAQAKQTRDQAMDRLTTLQTICTRLPSKEEAAQKEREVTALQQEWNAILREQQALPRPPLPPAQKPPFLSMEVPEALEMVRRDRKLYEQNAGQGVFGLLCALGIAGLVLAVVLQTQSRFALGAASAGFGAVAFAIALLTRWKGRKQLTILTQKYGSPDPARWTDALKEYETQLKAFHQAQQAYTQAQADVDVRLMVLRKRKDALCGSQEPEAMADYWHQTLAKWDALESARREAGQAQSYLDSLTAMAKTAPAPAKPDPLTYSQGETTSLRNQCSQDIRHLHSRLGQYQGRMEALGSREELEARLAGEKARIAALEQTYTALTIAQEALQQARQELQRRFAPKIARRAEELLGKLTQNRYERLTLGENFDLQAAAAGEDTLHDALWRSDGTIDQLYLALRLSVAEALTPDAPLILDDALVRFDDTRLKAALEILRQEGESRQVLAFTCQNREAQWAAQYAPEVLL